TRPGRGLSEGRLPDHAPAAVSARRGAHREPGWRDRPGARQQGAARLLPLAVPGRGGGVLSGRGVPGGLGAMASGPDESVAAGRMGPVVAGAGPASTGLAPAAAHRHIAPIAPTPPERRAPRQPA